MSILDKIGTELSGATFAQKSRELSGQSRLNGEQIQLEAKLRECFVKMGEVYYRALQKGIEPDCAKLMAEAGATEAELKKVQAELRRLRGVALCAGCGKEVPSSSRFCPNCGKELPRGHICSQCGAELETDAKFCVKCGNKVAQ